MYGNRFPSHESPERSGKTSLVDRFINPTKEEKAGHRELDEDGRKSSLPED